MRNKKRIQVELCRRRTEPDHLRRVEAALASRQVRALKGYLGYLPFGPDHAGYRPYYELAERHGLAGVEASLSELIEKVTLSPPSERAPGENGEPVAPPEGAPQAGAQHGP